eukprot:scaffold89353_cov35-Prasinocladus_malaysianus.AAC.2
MLSSGYCLEPKPPTTPSLCGRRGCGWALGPTTCARMSWSKSSPWCLPRPRPAPSLPVPKPQT